MVKVITAKHIYHATGHAVWPWEIDQLPDDWTDAILEYESAYPRKRALYNGRKYN